MEPEENQVPLHNIDAETAIMGAILYDNDLFHRMEGVLEDRMFFEPMYQTMYRIFVKILSRGGALDPIRMKDYLAIHPAFERLGGLTFLAQLVNHANAHPPTVMSYADTVRQCFLRRCAIKISQHIIKQAMTDPDTDGATLISGMEKELMSVKVGKTELSMVDIGSVAQGIVDDFTRPAESGSPLLMTGIEKIDKIIGGLEAGDLIVAGARPSMGKSALAGCIAMNVAKRGFGVLELNGEMSVQQMTRRHLTDEAFNRWGTDGPEYRQIKQFKLQEVQKDMLAEVALYFKDMPIQMLKRSGLTISQLKTIARREALKMADKGIKLKLLIIDHVGLIKPDDGGYSRVQDQTLVSGTCKELADELKCVVLALCQLSRKCEDREDKRPQLADLRDSGSWEQDADIVMGIYRDAYYARREQEPKTQMKKDEWFMRCSDRSVEAIMLKVREGDLGTAKLWADIGRNAIRDQDPTYLLI